MSLLSPSRPAKITANIPPCGPPLGPNEENMAKITLRTGDVLFEPLSRNTGEILEVLEHPSGKIVKIRWRVEDHLHHDTEHYYKKVLRAVKEGQYEYTPGRSPGENP